MPNTYPLFGLRRLRGYIIRRHAGVRSRSDSVALLEARKRFLEYLRKLTSEFTMLSKSMLAP